MTKSTSAQKKTRKWSDTSAKLFSKQPSQPTARPVQTERVSSPFSVRDGAGPRPAISPVLPSPSPPAPVVDPALPLPAQKTEKSGSDDKCGILAEIVLWLSCSDHASFSDFMVFCAREKREWFDAIVSNRAYVSVIANYFNALPGSRIEADMKARKCRSVEKLEWRGVY